ncbi:hypothetical protein PV328_007834 [Microctonus aethiopoides]|uniref:Uncharacterized protein n=1 Tax=Microctonus aethiopoides TaxID=144406 RepID=A0AA39F1J7_9HYME|nr:hypothetical protein PV328_007834 [Microctonus aethiopoides]
MSHFVCCILFCSNSGKNSSYRSFVSQCNKEGIQSLLCQIILAIFPKQYKNKEVNSELVLNKYNLNMKRNCESAINRQFVSTNSSWKKSFQRLKFREDDQNKRFNNKDEISNNLEKSSTSQKLLSPIIILSNGIIKETGDNEQVTQCGNSSIEINT